MDALIGADKLQWSQEKSALEKAKKDAQTERDAKNDLIATKDKEFSRYQSQSSRQVNGQPDNKIRNGGQLYPRLTKLLN